MLVKRTFQAAFWITVYILLTLAPIAILLLGPRPAGREFWRDFSVALGYSGLAVMGLQFVLTARFKVVKAPYGSDIVYYFHRQISFVAFVLILAHPLLLFIFDPKLLALLNLATAPWAARFGVTALLALVGLIVFSVWRKKLRIEYDRWRIWHGVLATAAVALALAHVELRGYYLTTLWKQIFWGLYSIFWIGLMVWVRIIKPILLIKKPYRVKKVVEERGNAWTLVLEPVGHPGFYFMPGQFAWLTIKDSPFRDHEHPFSFSGSSQEKELSFTIKALGDFTEQVKNIKPGDIVFVDGPFGAFSVDRHPKAMGYVFIAGGIGITPMMSMLRTLADRGETRPLLLIYANKSLESATFLEEIKDLEHRLNLVTVHVLEAPPEGWTGETGFVNTQVLERHIPADRSANAYEYYICGPAPMMNAVEKALLQANIHLGDFHSERFDLV